MADLIALRAGALSLEVAPEVGGAIAGFRSGAAALMRPTPRDFPRSDSVRAMASYPLIPFSGRIAKAAFAFGAETFRLARNFGDEPHAIHGIGWRRPWAVERADAIEAVLSLRHDPDADGAEGWPFAFAAEQRFTLAPNALTVTLAIVNTDARSQPAGLGLHPFFPLTDDTRLRFDADRKWETGSDLLPARAVACDRCWREGGLVGGAGLDNVFAGWSGRAELTLSGATLVIDADPVFGHLVIYTPTGKDYFAVEPVSHMADAINRMDQPGHGLKVLAPGEALSGRVRFGVSAAGR